MTDADWAAEFHGLEIAVGVVDSVQDAVEHIGRWTSAHTEAVLATDVRVTDYFCAAVDSAVVAVNASTRFTDGGEFGLGAEVGISTQKLHARGPMGLGELTRRRGRSSATATCGSEGHGPSSRESLATRYVGRCWSWTYSRPTYSPSTPRHSSCSVPTPATTASVDVHPGTVWPRANDTSA